MSSDFAAFTEKTDEIPTIGGGAAMCGSPMLTLQDDAP